MYKFIHIEIKSYPWRQDVLAALVVHSNKCESFERVI